MQAKANGSLCYPNPTRDGLLIYWYDGLPSPSYSSYPPYYRPCREKLRLRKAKLGLVPKLRKRFGVLTQAT